MRASPGRHGHGKGQGGKGAHDGSVEHRSDSRGHHDRTRARRGDVRTAIMILLAERPMHGYQLMQAMADSTAGAWRPSPGAVYPTIASLQAEGLITASDVDGRKVLTLTRSGRREVEARAARLGDPFAGFATEPVEPPLEKALSALTGAVGQLRREASPEQLVAAESVLAAARRSLYLILAD